MPTATVWNEALQASRAHSQALDSAATAQAKYEMAKLCFDNADFQSSHEKQQVEALKETAQNLQLAATQAKIKAQQAAAATRSRGHHAA